MPRTTGQNHLHVGEHRVLSIQEIWDLARGRFGIGCWLAGHGPTKAIVGLDGSFLVILPVLTLSETWTGYRIPEANDRIGGFGSGFMGGLSGHQGAIRAMFLSRRLPEKMGYAATASILALCVDLARIPVYLMFRPDAIIGEVGISLVLVISAILGVSDWGKMA